MNGRRYFIAARQSLSRAWMMAIITITPLYIFKFNFPRAVRNTQRCLEARAMRVVAWWQKGFWCAPTRAYNYYNDNSLPRLLEMCAPAERCVIIKVLFSLLMSYKHSNHRARSHSCLIFVHIRRALTRHLSTACFQCLFYTYSYVRETHLLCVDDGWSGNLNN